MTTLTQPIRPLSALLASLLSIAMLLSMVGCDGGHNAQLVIQRCADQDGTALSSPVRITVDGVSEDWNPGEALIFPIRVEDEVKVVTVVAEAGNGYTYVSKPQYDVAVDERKELELRFFRDYSITIEALDPNNFPILGVDVYANGRRVGTTDDRGYFVWSLSRENTRPGDTFEIALEKDGQSSMANPITITEGVFSYTAGAQLNIESDAPPIARTEVVDCSDPANQRDPQCRNRNQGANPQSTSSPPLARDEPQPQRQPQTQPERPPQTQPQRQPERQPQPQPRRPSSREATQRLTITTDPPGIEVILRDIDDAGNTERISKTPAEVNLKPGYYLWEVPATGEYLADASNKPIDLLTQNDFDLRITLSKETDMTPLQRGDQALRNGNVQQALEYYNSVGRSDAGAYKEAQAKIGQAYLRDSNPPDYKNAIAAYKAILSADPSEYSAHNNLAVVYFEIGSFDEAEVHLDKMLARKQLVPRDRRAALEREVRYRKGLIQNARFQSEQNLESRHEKGLLALSMLRDFIDLVPSGDASFGVKRQDAQEKHDAIKRWLDQNR